MTAVFDDTVPVGYPERIKDGGFVSTAHETISDERDILPAASSRVAYTLYVLSVRLLSE